MMSSHVVASVYIFLSLLSIKLLNFFKKNFFDFEGVSVWGGSAWICSQERPREPCWESVLTVL